MAKVLTRMDLWQTVDVGLGRYCGRPRGTDRRAEDLPEVVDSRTESSRVLSKVKLLVPSQVKIILLSWECNPQLGEREKKKSQHRAFRKKIDRPKRLLRGGKGEDMLHSIGC